MNLESCLVTGGCGFIGSHIVDSLIEDGAKKVTVLDNLSSGKISNITTHLQNVNFRFIEGDLGKMEMVENSLKDVHVVFHFAAHPEVRTSYSDPQVSFYENIRNTFHLLEGIRKSPTSQLIVFASSSTVYGEPSEIPTAENYGPLLPISAYGASKLACEALISSYGHNYGIDSIIFRFANIIGNRNPRGIIMDFIKKLRENNSRLEVLGNGSQSKSYLYISDCISAIFSSLSHENNDVEIFNVGNDDMITANNIARIICDAMNLKKVQLNFGSGDSKGWIGDVTTMQLDITKLKKLGWVPQLSSEEAVMEAANVLRMSF